MNEGDYPIYCFGYFQTCNPDHYIGKRRSHQRQIHCYGLIVNCLVHEDLSTTYQLFDHFYSCNITGVDKLDRSIHHNIMEQSGNFVNKGSPSQEVHQCSYIPICPANCLNTMKFVLRPRDTKSDKLGLLLCNKWVRWGLCYMGGGCAIQTYKLELFYTTSSYFSK